MYADLNSPSNSAETPSWVQWRWLAEAARHPLPDFAFHWVLSGT